MKSIFLKFALSQLLNPKNRTSEFWIGAVGAIAKLILGFLPDSVAAEYIQPVSTLVDGLLAYAIGRFASKAVKGPDTAVPAGPATVTTKGE